MSITESRMISLLTTNAPPSDQEAQLIREATNELDVRLVDLDAEITRLKQEQLAIKARRDAHQVILSPARKVPMDIWRVIFLNCLPEEEYISPKALSAPLLLCQICGTLRELAISIPTLWASIAARAQVSYEPDYTTSYSPHPILVHLWLSRSGTGPLSLSYRVSSVRDLSCMDVRSHKTLDIFTEHSARWNRVRFIFDGSASPPILVKKFPSLECVEIEASGNISFHPAPNLRRVSFHTTRTPLLTFQTMFPDPQNLIDVAFTCPVAPNSMIEVLHLCPHVQSLRFDILNHLQGELQISCLPVQHLALQSLELSYDSHLAEFFNNVTFPMLSSIKVERPGAYQTTWVDYREFESFLSRSACALQKLSLINVCIRESHLTAILQAVTNSVVELHLVLVVDHVSVEVTEGLILKVLTVRSPKIRPICSRLTTLSLDIRVAGNLYLHSRTRAKKGLLADLVRSRWAGYRHNSLFSRLEAITVCSSQYSVRDLRLLEEYSTQGLKVTLLE